MSKNRKSVDSFCPGTSRDRGVCPGTFAPALVPGQRDSGTSRPVETLAHSSLFSLLIKYVRSALNDFFVGFVLGEISSIVDEIF